MWDTLSQHPLRLVWTLLIALATTIGGLGATLFFLYDLSQTVHDNKVTLHEVRADQAEIRKELAIQTQVMNLMFALHNYAPKDKP